MVQEHGHEVRWFDPGDDADSATIERLLVDGSVRERHDWLARQLADLADARARRRLDERERAATIKAILGDTPLEHYGRWVLYPWSGRLVRLLPRAEFRELRLDRNRHKLTDVEQERLGRLVVGVVGLSVGNAVALTLAMEGLVDTLKLADFDTLELSNLNRLRAGVHEIGVSKVVIAARQVAEIDPDVQVRVLPEGITPDNVERFLTADPPVDLLVEECDAWAIKLLLREHARAHRIPVLMETSDRGTLDIERFDLEPDRPSLHGLLGALTSRDLERLSPEQQVAAMLPMIGAGSLSPRLAASMIERGESVLTWPQLASEVVLGGATVATAVRQLGLGRPLASGRVHIDAESLVIGERAHEHARPTAATAEERDGTAAVPPRPAGSSGPARNGTDRDGGHPHELARFLVEQAILAPSGGNAQRWRFESVDSALRIRRDDRKPPKRFERSGHADLVALGAAIENLRVAAAHRGFRADVVRLPDPADPANAAEISLVPANADPAGEAELRALARRSDQIAVRSTNRHPGTRGPVDPTLLREMGDAAQARGAHVQLVTDGAALADVGELVGEADRIRLVNPELHRDAIAEMRFSEAEAHRTRDGIDLRSLELAPHERVVADVTARADVVAVLRDVGGGAALRRTATRAFAGASGAGLIRVTDPGPVGWLRAGEALEALWLAATEHGLGLQPWTSLVYMLDMLDTGSGDAFSSEESRGLLRLRERLDDTFGDAVGSPPALLFRFVHAPPPSCRSLRLAVEDVLSAGRSAPVALSGSGT